MILGLTLRASALLYVGFGVVFVVVPTFVPWLLGFTIEPGPQVVGRSYGGLLVGVGVANWMARRRPFAEVRLLVVANLIWQPLSTFALFLGAGLGAANGLAWGFGGLHVLMGVGFALALTEGARSATIVARPSHQAAPGA